MKPHRDGWFTKLVTVPELTRGVDIKLNARVSLRCATATIRSSNRTLPYSFGSTVAKSSGDHIPLVGFVPTKGKLPFLRAAAEESRMISKMKAQSDDHFHPRRESSKPAWADAWHLWTVIVPRRTITGRLAFGKVWRRHDGHRWLYKKFVEYDDCRPLNQIDERETYL